MTALSTLLTHPGAAHKDEFLACSVLLARHPVPLHRREPTPADLADVATCVIDVGHEHTPARNNFDHHQFPKDHPPTCSLSLVLQHLGVYDDARQFCDWLEAVEWIDSRGPFETAKRLGIDRETLAKLNSPVDLALIRRFAAASVLRPGEPLWETLRMIGEDLLDFVTTLRARLDFLGRHAVIWELPAASGHAGCKVLFVPRTDPFPAEPSMGVERYVDSLGLSAEIVAQITPDRRSVGYALTRFRDNARVDFTRVASRPDVHFTHARGFVAKTTATHTADLRELIALSLKT